MQITIIQALLITLITWIISSGEALLAYPMVNQPLVLCPIVGLILGDFGAGVVMGATLQLVFLGVMGIGGTMPPDSTLGSVIGTAYAITMGASVDVALTFAVPIALVGSIFTLVGYLLRGVFNPMTERFCAAGNTKGLERLHLSLAFLPDFPKILILFLALIFGAGPAETLISVIPEVVTAGLEYASDLMPAVGIALLLRMMWSKKMAVYFFAGFLLVAYLNLPLLAVAGLGVVLAVVLFLENWSREKKTQMAATNGTATAEEELFND